MNATAPFDTELFFRAFMATPTAVCMTSPDGSILHVNQGFLRLYGYTIDEVIGGNPRILKSGRHAPEVYETMWRQLLDPACGSWQGELINRDKAGDVVIVNLFIEAVRDNDGELHGFLANAYDISKWKRLEQSLIRQNERLNEINKLQTEMLAVTSHDLKAPLNAIISRANLIKSCLDTMTTAKVFHHLDGIVDSGMKLGEFIEEQLNLAKIESGQISVESERLSLDSLLRSLTEINQFAADSKQIAIRYTLHGRVRPLYGDRVKLEQVFNNLLSNAIKFAPTGSVIDVTCTPAADRCRVDITDQGPGIPAEEIKHIFDRFYQVRSDERSVRNHGAGLGLSIVHNFVNLHQGQVTVRNNPDGGCCFSVELPLPGCARSGKDLAAVIVDPNGDIYPLLKQGLLQAGVSRFVCKSANNLQRTLDHSYPEIMFIPDSAINDEITTIVANLAARQSRPVTVLVDNGSGTAPQQRPKCDYQLTLPGQEDTIPRLIAATINSLNGCADDGL